jgi:hypothetical protein
MDSSISHLHLQQCDLHNPPPSILGLRIGDDYICLSLSLLKRGEEGERKSNDSKIILYKSIKVKVIFLKRERE